MVPFFSRTASQRVLCSVPGVVTLGVVRYSYDMRAGGKQQAISVELNTAFHKNIAPGTQRISMTSAKLKTSFHKNIRPGTPRISMMSAELNTVFL
jgi:hypothetical protein